VIFWDGIIVVGIIVGIMDELGFILSRTFFTIANIAEAAA
jgi:hypothetical protein